MPSQWQKSSFSGIDAEDCVEVARAEPRRLLLRESDAADTVIAVPPAGLLALIHQVKGKT
ncbi:DUF397 domain-containing protein [Streptomyces sp. NBC_01485]|uniref:DUF397 domain-containing protein n=1 Tax=Streptomyces sp. NBC_01485 TaxID=2903884 RepID=UPI002E347DFC|nr:DUF397 domain-containing protein [Streptomyces sp. NBC_01485]